MNIVEIEEAVSALAEKPFDPDTFFFELAAAYDAPPVTIARLKKGDTGQSDVNGAIIWQPKIHFFHSRLSAQVGLDTLAGSKKGAKAKVRFLLATDGEEIGIEDREKDERTYFKLSEFGDHFGKLLPVAGYDRYRAADENPVDIKATGRLAKLYDALVKENPDWGGAARRHEMNAFMTRLVFCLFAEDTAIFAENLFSKTLTEYGGSEGGNAQILIRNLFDVMDLAPDLRAGKPAYQTVFPYVNGGLFAGGHDCPRFSKTAWRYLMEATRLNWALINPDIFGSMIQTIVDPSQRGELGMHYTSVPNILKVLDPLFLDYLRTDLKEAWDSKKKLLAFLDRLEKTRVFDPACGSGNFLVIAYRKLRELEIEAMKRLEALGEDRGKAMFSRVHLNNFFGIEYADFAAETAKLALWIAEFQMNKLFGSVFGFSAPALPLKESGNIVCDNALRVDWATVCPLSTVGGDTWVVGNPPYLGAKKREDYQTEDMVMSGMTNMLLVDYVAAWFVQGRNYLRGHVGGIAFVATSSICQGEQVALLWPEIFVDGLEIGFAYAPFKWSNSAARNAGVFCTIVGIFSLERRRPKRLYDGDVVKNVKVISPYLIEHEFVPIVPSGASLFGLPEMVMGSNPVDGKWLALSSEQRDEFILEDERAVRFIKPFMAGGDFIDGTKRYCLWINDSDVPEALLIEPIRKRIQSCQTYRAGAGRDARKTANRPHSFCYRTYLERPAIISPNTCAHTRQFHPVGLIDSDVIINHAAFAIYDQSPHLVALLSSTLHRIWLGSAGGRLGNGFRYSVTLVYNTFPVPPLSAQDKSDLDGTARGILFTRAYHVGKTIAELYNPEEMPDDLREAHRKNDEVIEKIYIGRTFRNDTERLEHLFQRYSKMMAAKAKAEA